MTASLHICLISVTIPTIQHYIVTATTASPSVTQVQINAPDRPTQFATQQGKKFSSSPEVPHRMWGALSLLLNGYQGSFSEVKMRKGEAEHSHPSTAEVKN
jgi:hypothetical protein